METEHFDFCCPVEGELDKQWNIKLQNELREIHNHIESKKLVLKMISHPIRLSILYFTNTRPHCVCEMVQKLQVGNSNISYHLSRLSIMELIKGENHGGRAYYALTDYGKKIIQWLRELPEN